MSHVSKSKDIVRRIREEDKEILVSFYGHDGYFQIPDTQHSEELLSKVRRSNKEQEEISFEFDKDLNILRIE